jgi:hypothetical protein
MRARSQLARSQAPARLVHFFLFVFALGACSTSDERRSLRAVKRLLRANEVYAPTALSELVAFGPYALVDIEQELPGAKQQGRLRLIEAIGRIGDREALPFLRVIGRWDDDPLVRKTAKEVMDQLALSAAPSRQPKILP